MEPNAPDPAGKRGQSEPSPLPEVPDGWSGRCRGHEPHLEPLAGAGAVGITPGQEHFNCPAASQPGFPAPSRPGRARSARRGPARGAGPAPWSPHSSAPSGAGRRREGGRGRSPAAPAERAQPLCRSRGGERRQRGLSGRGPGCVRDVQTPPRCPLLFKGPRLNLPRLPCLGAHGTHCSQLEWDLGKVQRKGREHLFFRPHC